MLYVLLYVTIIIKLNIKFSDLVEWEVSVWHYQNFGFSP